jgi:hypothetical protein
MGVRNKKGLSLLVLTFVFLLALVTPQLCRADSSDSLNFQTSDQSMWISGLTNAVNYQIFNVDQPVSVNDTFGGISTTSICFLFGSCISTGSYGVQVGANISGDVGANLNLTLTGGSVNAAVPVNVSLGFPSTVASDTTFDITSSGLFQPGASLTTQSPGVILSMNATADLAGSISGEACAGGCVSQAASVNTNGPQTVNVFTTDLASVALGTSIHISPYVVLQLDDAPYVGTSAKTTATADAGNPLTLSSSALGKSPFVSINADIGNLIAAGLGLPPPDGSFPLGPATLSYNLFEFLGGIGLDSTQSFTLTATPEVAYSVQDIGSDPQSFTTTPMPVGSTNSFSIPAGDTAALVTPTYSMAASLTNDSGLVPAINLEFSALGLKYASIGISHLVDLSLPIPFNGLEATVFNDTFPLVGWNTVEGTPFEITATNPTAGVPEPPTLFLLGAGLLLMACFSRRRYQAKVLGHQV